MPCQARANIPAYGLDGACRARSCESRDLSSRPAAAAPGAAPRALAALLRVLLLPL